MSENSFNKIKEFSRYITSINTKESSNQYIDELFDEILELSYRADTIPVLLWKTNENIHLGTRRLLVKNGKFAVLFHVIGNYVMIDDIVPSKLLYKKVK